MSDKPMLKIKTKQEIELAKFEEIKSRLLSRRIVLTDGCWLFTGTITDRGYGQIWFKNEPWYTHRLSMFLFKPEEYKESLMVLHTCDIEKCFNPEHLFSGTGSDNKQDEIAKGRNWHSRQTHCPHGHEFTPENTRVRTKGRNSRECIICIKKRANFNYLTKGL